MYKEIGTFNLDSYLRQIVYRPTIVNAFRTWVTDKIFLLIIQSLILPHMRAAINSAMKGNEDSNPFCRNITY